ncbi:DIS3-like exonuclease 2 [Cichlidogyrus casuarinus]|uniref:DIS3-like exonuclease 2 n=1 Tax=Cichlidogyrus casuarinus TaxID=1844966 RepID=A0ABD2QME8_9PLAT
MAEYSEKKNTLPSVVQVPIPSNALLNGKSRTRNSSTKSIKSLCEPHLPHDVILKNLKNNTLISGTLRVNPKNYEDAFITHLSGDVDIYITGLANRNRAFNSDFVAVEINPRGQWRVFDKYVPKKTLVKPEIRKKPSYTSLSELISLDSMQLSECLGPELANEFESDLQTNLDPKTGAARLWVNYIQRTGKVVGIIKKQHSRICIGTLKPVMMTSKPSKSSLSMPSSELIPGRKNLHITGLPQELNFFHLAFVTQPDAYKFHRFIGQISDWPENSCYAVGTLIDHIEPKEANLVDFETTRILTGCGYVAGAKAAMKFSDEINESVQKTIDDLETQQEREMRFREDMRDRCVFSVDPETARDLDDAVHVRELSKEEVAQLKATGLHDPMYEVGVHIADVSYFVRPDSPTDLEAARRATSVYLVQLCVPMLPRKLCEDLCSLNAGQKKFTFSVIFIVNSDAQILSHRFNRTVINSCAKLSYEDCQAFLDLPESEWALDPSRINGNFSLSHIGRSIHILNKLAVKMRSSRNLGGSLQLNQIKACFTLSDESRMPVGLCPFVARPANRMIEEWMLAANQKVATHLAERLPQEAFMRHHPSPNAKAISETNLILRSIGYENCDLDSAASIQKFLCQLAGCPIELGWQLHENLLEMCAFALDKMQLNDTVPGSHQGKTSHSFRLIQDISDRNDRSLFSITSLFPGNIERLAYIHLRTTT